PAIMSGIHCSYSRRGPLSGREKWRKDAMPWAMLLTPLNSQLAAEAMPSPMPSIRSRPQLKAEETRLLMVWPMPLNTLDSFSPNVSPSAPATNRVPPSAATAAITMPTGPVAPTRPVRAAPIEPTAPLAVDARPANTDPSEPTEPTAPAMVEAIPPRPEDNAEPMVESRPPTDSIPPRALSSSLPADTTCETVPANPKREEAPSPKVEIISPRLETTSSPNLSPRSERAFPREDTLPLKLSAALNTVSASLRNWASLSWD